MKKKALAVAGLMALGLVAVGSAGFAEEESSGSASFWEKTKVTGQFNSSYNFNFNNPPLGSAATAFSPTANNSLRVFDTRHNDFDFNLIDFVVENSPVDWAKFRFDLNFGEDVAVVDATKGGVIGTDEFALQQAYAELTAPVGKGLTFKIGQFVTQTGYEVIESASNLNTSRSFLFGFAIPFAHTGVLMTYPFSDTVSGSLGVVNGWDVVADNNKGKTLLGQLTWKPYETLFLSLQGTFGPEQAASDRNLRGLVDFVGTWTPNDQWTVGLNYDLGKEEGLGVAAASGGIVNWHGGALYTHYKPFDFFGLTLRAEMMQDDGSRLGLGTDTTALEGTGTAHFYMGDGWETRLEIRHDHLDHARGTAFTRANAATRKFQDTASAEIVYAF